MARVLSRARKHEVRSEIVGQAGVATNRFVSALSGKATFQGIRSRMQFYRVALLATVKGLELRHQITSASVRKLKGCYYAGRLVGRQ